MASERQIEANRRNAALSSGPKSELGKSRSRANATKHGMASELPSVEAPHSAEFEDRRARWSAEFAPVGEAGHWALDRAVAASLRIEKCEQAFDGLVESGRDRARLAWDQDRAVEAATIAGRLAKDPVLASRQLETTRAGVALLLEMWLRLVEALRAEGGWSDLEVSRALDLLGVPADLRSGRTPIDGPEGADPAEFRRELALDEIARLEGLRDDAMVELDEIERRQAMAGDDALFSKPAKLVLRYERDAWRRYRESIREVQAPAAAPVEAPTAPMVEAIPSRTVELPTAPSFEEERRSLLAEAAAFLRSANAQPTGSMDFIDEDAWLDELERSCDVMDQDPRSSRPAVTERTRLVGIAVGPQDLAGSRPGPR
jgi:hypothetical protein